MRVKLINSTKHHPLDAMVAGARTCYTKDAVTPQQVKKRVKNKGSKARDELAQSVFGSGHHTTLEHSVFTFLIEGVSRQALWSFLHSHPFYNSSQQSQRYVTMSADGLVIPQGMSRTERKNFKFMTRKQFSAYHSINDLLFPIALNELQDRFPHLRKQENKYTVRGMAQKKVQEIGRYVLPVATAANLHHTINALTLHRYKRLKEWFDVPNEVSTLVDKMCARVERKFPGFFDTLVTDYIPLADTPEFNFFMTEDHILSTEQMDANTTQFKKEFDQRLRSQPAKLVDYMHKAEKTLADSVREVLGIPQSSLSDQEAIERVLDPRYNPHMGHTLNVKMMSPLCRTLAHAVYTFKVKLSHTADSQAQRHRTVPVSRPLFEAQFTSDPDYITPQLLHSSPEALELYQATMQDIWGTANNLINDGLEFSEASYLLPNATTIRYTETANLFALHHLMIERLCLNAQEEIFHLNRAKANEIRRVHPQIGKYLDAPCILRRDAEIIPRCKEGNRYCGVPVWREDSIFNFERKTL
ncbi:MAG: FAD-dependent thymidylate synthase [archaeon]